MLELVVDKITKDDLIQLKSCLEKHSKGLTKDVFPAEGDMLFHKILAQATHNKVFIELHDDIYMKEHINWLIKIVSEPKE